MILWGAKRRLMKAVSKAMKAELGCTSKVKNRNFASIWIDIPCEVFGGKTPYEYSKKHGINAVVEKIVTPAVTVVTPPKSSGEYRIGC